jgi:hypothetical protein
MKTRGRERGEIKPGSGQQERRIGEGYAVSQSRGPQSE